MAKKQESSKKPTITNHSGQKPYVRSTLLRKYKALDISVDDLFILHNYLKACANFFYIIELEEARKNFRRMTGISIPREIFYEVVSIDARNGYLDYWIYPETEFYEDGDKNKFLLIADKAITDFGEDQYTEEERREFYDYIEKNRSLEGYTGKVKIQFDAERFDTLYTAKSGKKEYYYPKDLLKYEDPGYFTHTLYTDVMESYLADVIGASSEEADKRLWKIIDTIRDPKIIYTDEIQHVVRLATGVDPWDHEAEVPLTEAQMRRFFEIYMDVSRNTYLPSNNGFTPDDLSRDFKGSQVPETIHFGKGIRDAMANGSIDLAELKESFMQNRTYSPQMKNTLMNGLNEAQQIIQMDKKVGRNDPCPCGSGKKYKKCCGR